MKAIAIVALLAGCNLAIAQPLSGIERQGFAEVAARQCYTIQRGGALNKPLPDAAIKGYCECYANKVADRVTVQDLHELFRIGQASGATAAQQEFGRRFDVIGAALQCSAPYTPK